VKLSFGIQGSGQHVEGGPEPGFFRAVAKRAEAAGYDSIWAGDHISYRNPILDVTVALSTFAAVTERIVIGAAIVLLPLRHPSLVAKAFSSLDFVSGGRVVLGVGVGGEGPKDFEAVGVPVSERGARTDEAMRALRELFGGGPASFAGRFFAFEGVEIAPGPAQPGGPPLWVGGRSEAAVRRAGRLGDGWIPIWVSAERFERSLAVVRRHAEEAGRDPEAIVPAVVLPAHVDDAGERARREILAHLSLRYAGRFEPHVVDRYCVAGTPAECAARVHEYVAAGARHVVFNPSGPAAGYLEEIERLFADVAAGVAA
jgi:probable F420-dependent oxidoreductase